MISDTTIQGNFTFLKTEYERCHFLDCNIDQSDFSSFIFNDCIFKTCNLSLIKLEKTALRNIKFIDCKMFGINFEICNKFGLSLSFQNCLLNHSSFYNCKIPQTAFNNCKLIEVDFTGSNLSNSLFENCDLFGAIFQDTNLERVDFRTSWNYTLDPGKNRIKKAKFSSAGITGLLSHYDIEIE